MFETQLLKLVNRLIDMTEKELALVKKRELIAAAAMTEEKDPLVQLYQQCVTKMHNDRDTFEQVKAWSGFAELKDRIFTLDELSKEYEAWIRSIEKSQRTFVEQIQEKVLNVVSPLKSYNKQGGLTNRANHYVKLGGGSIATLDQSL